MKSDQEFEYAVNLEALRAKQTINSELFDSVIQFGITSVKVSMLIDGGTAIALMKCVRSFGALLALLVPGISPASAQTVPPPVIVEGEIRANTHTSSVMIEARANGDLIDVKPVSRLATDDVAGFAVEGAKNTVAGFCWPRNIVQGRFDGRRQMR